jgi:hypothetical protein
MENVVLYIHRVALTVDPRSLLNLRISKFSMKNLTLFEARSALRLAVEMTLRPGEYAEGYLADSGSPSGHVFELNDITFHRSNLMVRVTNEANNTHIKSRLFTAPEKP